VVVDEPEGRSGSEQQRKRHVGGNPEREPIGCLGHSVLARARTRAPRMSSSAVPVPELRDARSYNEVVATTEDERGIESLDDWRALYDSTPERDGELSSTISGLPNEPLYTPENVEIDYERDL